MGLTFYEFIDKYQHSILLMLTFSMILLGTVFTLGQPQIGNRLKGIDYIFLIMVLTGGLVWWLYTLMSLFTYIYNREIIYTIVVIFILMMLMIVLVGIYQYMNYITIQTNGKLKGAGYLTGIHITILVLTVIICGLIYVYHFK